MTAARPIRVLVIDDSAFARKVMREVLSWDPEIELVGPARDGLDALEKIQHLQPDVICLDLMMPGLDGIGVLDALRDSPKPRVVVVSTAPEDSDLAIRALQAGAVDVVHKPTALATDRLYDLGPELVAKVKAAAGAHPRRVRPVIAPEPAPAPRLRAAPVRLVVIATSTGGPQALTRILPELPRDLPVPVAVVAHMPVGFTSSLAARLAQDSAIDVVEAYDALPLRPGLVVLGRAGMHLKIDGAGDGARARLDVTPLESLHKPSADVLFRSAAIAFGPDVLGVVLTGMGEDGLDGARGIRAAGGVVVTEAEETCVVYGMPRAVFEAGLSDRAVRLDRVAALIKLAV